MASKSPQLEEAEKIRDEIALMIGRFEKSYPGLRLVIYTESIPSAPPTGVGGQASIGWVWADVVARDGTHKTTKAVDPAEVASA